MKYHIQFTFNQLNYIIYYFIINMKGRTLRKLSYFLIYLGITLFITGCIWSPLFNIYIKLKTI